MKITMIVSLILSTEIENVISYMDVADILATPIAQDMAVILTYYGIGSDQVNVIPYQHPLSSYLWVEDGRIIDETATITDLRAMFGL